ncbi:MAG TPA: hypothetical protein VF517_07995 [Thermoleophilaceae bacterium]|jgi:hypothetical protein
MTTRTRLSLILAATFVLAAVPAGDASAASCSAKGYKTLDQNKYIVVQRGPGPKGDSTSDYGVYACRISTGKRRVLGGNECFGNDLGEVGDYALASNYIAYEARTCGDPEGESDAVSLNVATGAKKRFSAEHEPLAGGVVDYSITSLKVNSKGNMAWIAQAKHLSGGNQTRFDVRRAINGVADRVDVGPGIVGDSLAYSAGRIYWLNGDVPKVAALP